MHVLPTLQASNSNGDGLGAGFGGKNCRLVDPTNPDFKSYAWRLLQESYHSIGIRVFWLDNSEPWSPPPDALFGKPGVAGGSGWSWADAGALFDVQWPVTRAPPCCVGLGFSKLPGSCNIGAPAGA